MFKAGDKVKRAFGGEFAGIRLGDICTVVSHAGWSGLILEEGEEGCTYDSNYFMLHETLTIQELELAVKTAEIALQEAKDSLKAATAVTYKVGDRFQDADGTQVFTLYRVSADMVAVLGNKSFNRWRDPVKVKDVYKITAAEMEKIAGLSEGLLIKISE